MAPISPQARELAPSLDQIKLPDKYRMLPVPKIEMLGTPQVRLAAHHRPPPRTPVACMCSPRRSLSPQDPTVVQLSRPSRAPQITLRENEQGVALSAVGYKGFRMVRATHGVSNGCYYYEVLVQEPLHGEDGHMRIGWSTEAGDLQAPVGYDVNSYAYRDVNGAKFHESIGEAYGEPYKAGDVIGCMLRMGEPGAIVRQRQRFRDPKGVEYLVEEERARVPSVGSVLAFYKNGKPLGPAFTDVHAEQYFPAASLYRAACLTFNFGPSFAFPPPDLDVDAYSPVSSLAAPKSAQNGAVDGVADGAVDGAVDGVVDGAVDGADGDVEGGEGSDAGEEADAGMDDAEAEE